MMSKTPVDVVPDVLVLAAIDRAERHRGGDARGVPVWHVMDHLDIPRRSGRARRLHARLDELEAAGSIERSRRHSNPVVALTSHGRRCLSRARRAGESVELPESPQHRRWRDARRLAEQEIDRVREHLRGSLAVAGEMLDGDLSPDSDMWFVLAERLRHGCRCMGSVSYCLYEWVEPSDELADIDDRREPIDMCLDSHGQNRRRALRAGRRSIRPLEDG